MITIYLEVLSRILIYMLLARKSSGLRANNSVKNRLKGHAPYLLSSFLLTAAWLLGLGLNPDRFQPSLVLALPGSIRAETFTNVTIHEIVCIIDHF